MGIYQGTEGKVFRAVGVVKGTIGPLAGAVSKFVGTYSRFSGEAGSWNVRAHCGFERTDSE